MRKMSKAGFTLVECVIAMLVIAIITGTAIGIYEVTIRSVNKQWENYQVAQMSDNILACFQGSDDIDNFENHLSHIRSVGKTNIGTGTINDDSSYLEYDTAEAEMPTAFKTIRAYETGKVEFYNEELDLNKDYTSPLLTLDYKNNDNYEYDVHGKTAPNSQSLDNLGLYNVETKMCKAGYASITATYKHSSKDRVSFEYTVTEDTVTVKATDTMGTATTRSYETTVLEKYLLEKGWFVKMVSGNTRNINILGYKAQYVAFEVYDCKTGKIAVDEKGNRMYVMIKGSIKDEDWADGSSEFNVTEVDFARMSGYFSTPTMPGGLSRSDYTEKFDEIGDGFTWKYLPAYVWNTNDDYHAFNYDKCSHVYREAGPLYSDYTMKEAAFSEIVCTIEGSNYIKFYNGNGMIYRYTFTTDGLSKELTSLPLEFDSVRAYKNGTIALYKSGKPVYSYSYKDTSAYNETVSRSLSNREVYNAGVKQNAGKTVVRVSGGDKISGFEYMGYEMQGSCNYYVDAGEGKYILCVYEDTKTNSSRDKKKYEDANALETDLAKKGLILYFDKYSLDKTGRCFYLYVIDAATGKLKTDADGKNMFIRLSYKSDSAVSGRWNNSSMYFNVSKVEQGFSSAGNANDLRKDKSVVYSAYGSFGEFKWSGAFLPYVYNVCDKAFSSPEGRLERNHVYIYKELNSYEFISEYTEYTPKDASLGKVTDYFETAAGAVFIGKNNTVLLFNRELGMPSASGNIDSLVSAIKTGLGFDKEKTDGVTGGNERYCMLGNVKLAEVVFNDTTHTIAFNDAKGKSVIKFEYGNSTDGISNYNLDKGEITVEGGAYYEFFDGNKVKGNGSSVLRKGADSTGHPIYQVSLKTEDDPYGTIIFISYATTIGVNSSDVSSDVSYREVEAVFATPDIYEWTTKYYSYTISYYSLIVKVTYSKYTGDVSIEPSIKIWLVTTDRLNEWLSEQSDSEVPEEPTEAAYIYYRKG